MFAWKVIHNGLATQANKKARCLEHQSTCIVCGDECEDGYHAIMQCPHAVNLRTAMRMKWQLPAERDLKFSGPIWLLRIVDAQPVDKAACLLIFWRAWFIRNELTHSLRKISIEGSISFLENYWEKLCRTRQQGIPDDKGKAPINSMPQPAGERRSSVAGKWSAPSEGWIKINVDGAFKSNGDASLGVVIRDDAGTVLLSAWRVVANASCAEEVEIMACREGIALAAQWTPRRAILESDCSRAIKYLSNPEEQRTSSAFVIREAKGVGRKSS